jgi:L-seryl-tRNA(Ser) seleniumtransferase
VQRLQQHPLMRALRVDKLTFAALEATLGEYRAGRAAASVPVVRMLTTSAEIIEARAQQLAAHLHAAGWHVALMSGASAVGGGSAPGIELDTVLVAIERPQWSADTLEEKLRTLDPPVIARIEGDRVVLDLRTVFEEQDQPLAAALAALTQG